MVLISIGVQYVDIFFMNNRDYQWIKFFNCMRLEFHDEFQFALPFFVNEGNNGCCFNCNLGLNFPGS